MRRRVIRGSHFKPGLEAGVRCFLAVFTAESRTRRRVPAKSSTPSFSFTVRIGLGSTAGQCAISRSCSAMATESPAGNRALPDFVTSRPARTEGQSARLNGRRRSRSKLAGIHAAATTDIDCTCWAKTCTSISSPGAANPFFRRDLWKRFRALARPAGQRSAPPVSTAARHLSITTRRPRRPTVAAATKPPPA
jgi:hypothetical protein